MSGESIRKLFEQRSEWGARKHELLENYVVPATQKLKRFGDLALIDGYAGMNQYGSDLVGSTHIMLNAAKKLIEKGHGVKVHACEPDPEICAMIRKVFAKELYNSTLLLYPHTHQEAAPMIQKAIGDRFALVFLDPEKPKQMLFDESVRPWLEREKTDVLGIYFATRVYRACAGARTSSEGSQERKTAEGIIGPDWQEVDSEAHAVRKWRSKCSPFKKFFATYPVRKADRQENIYEFWGASQSHHGFALLSDAVARDSKLIEDYDAKKALKRTGQFKMFETEGREAEFMNLVEIVRPIVAANPKIRSRDIYLGIHADPANAQQVFGKFTTPNVTEAAKFVRQEKMNA